MAKQIDDPENPEWTPEMVARARRGIAHLPGPMREAIENTRRGRGPQKAPRKAQITLRLSVPVLTAYKSTGPGWQSRINADLELTAARIMAKSGGVFERNAQPGRGRVYRGPLAPSADPDEDVAFARYGGRRKGATKKASKKR